jgi:hypothetical protein
VPQVLFFKETGLKQTRQDGTGSHRQQFRSCAENFQYAFAECRMIFLCATPVTMRNKASLIVTPLVEDSLALIQFHDWMSLRKT